MRVNFVTNLGLQETSGGGSAVNSMTYHQLQQHFEVNYVGAVQASDDLPAKALSKALRVLGRSGSFHFFSQRRLTRIAAMVASAVDDRADCDFFHGPTSWVLYDSPRPYYLYSDACFSTYMDTFHDRSRFWRHDLKRICDLETRWLARATRVFFRTQWALEETARAYKLPQSNMRVAGVGGNMPVPASDKYLQDRGRSAGEIELLFVAHDFQSKGGRICCEAFRQVQARFPQARLTLLGGQPPEDVLGAGISYGGFLRKTAPEELARLQEIFSRAFLLIHPTSSDTNPLVITEAGYHGCPSVASNSFGIPELIRDGVTGFLVDPPLRPEEFAAKIVQLALDPGRYQAMRRAVRAHTTTNLTWQSVGDCIAQEMTGSLTG